MPLFERIGLPAAIAALALYFPALKVLEAMGVSPQAWAFSLFYGGGCVLSLWVVHASGLWGRIAPLFSHPFRGIWEALCLFAALLALAALLLLFPPLQPYLPLPLYDLIADFDPFTLYIAYHTGDWGASLPDYPVHGVAALVEEWLFRGVMLWGWIQWRQASPMDLAQPEVWVKILVLNTYFALVHWPQPLARLFTALLGGIVLSLLLVKRRNLSLIGVLHMLYNWKLLAG